jgi:hypothetical protein
VAGAAAGGGGAPPALELSGMMISLVEKNQLYRYSPERRPDSSATHLDHCA